MIKKNNIQDIFKELDLVLKAKDKVQELTIFGSGALMAQGLSKEARTTEDIDVVNPPFDNEMWVASAEAGEKFNMEMGWLNTAGVIFSRNFPEGWEHRTIEVYNGQNLKVKALGRQDMISTKLQAYCDRGFDTDKEDLEGLRPKKQELETAKAWLIIQKPELKKIAEDRIKEFLGKD